MHYLPFEQRRDLVDSPWNKIPELFLPSRILQLVFLSLPNLPMYGMQSISMLCWCPLEDVEKFLRKKADDMEWDFLDSAEKQLWRQHPLYKQKRETLEGNCKEKGVQSSSGNHLLVKRLASVDSSALHLYSRSILGTYQPFQLLPKKSKSFQLVVLRQFFTSIIYELNEVKISLCCGPLPFEQAPHISYLKENLKP